MPLVQLARAISEEQMQDAAQTDLPEVLPPDSLRTQYRPGSTDLEPRPRAAPSSALQVKPSTQGRKEQLGSGTFSVLCSSCLVERRAV